MTTGILFVGHGTKNEQGLAEFRTLISHVARRLPSDVRIVHHSFVEFAEPTVVEGIHQCIADGATDVLLVPIFLFTAQHLKRDVPGMMAKASASHPDVTLRMTPSLGHLPAFLSVAAERLRQAGYESGSDAPVLLIGRGNKDPKAQATFEQAALRLHTDHNVSRLETAYLSGTGVRMESVLQTMVKRGEREVWILPYLWFAGYLTEKLPDRVARVLRGTGVCARIASYLGVHDALVNAILDEVDKQLEHRCMNHQRFTTA
jgi:sirohydrochlorin ferrochelatase